MSQEILMETGQPTYVRGKRSQPQSPQNDGLSPSSATISRAIGPQKQLKSADGTNEYVLPPPPTRSRRIIQMKPRTSQDSSDASAGLLKSPEQPQAKPRAAASTGKAGGQKRKQANEAGSAAGRKNARKTAHSLIERRRRNKMNEEFSVLKDMIPACSGQDMHKLQVLSASIEYMRYLESCLGDLKAVHASCATRPTLAPTAQMSIPSSSRDVTFSPIIRAGSDLEHSGASSPSPGLVTTNRIGDRGSRRSHLDSISPAIIPSTNNSPCLSSHQQPEHSGVNRSGFVFALPSPVFDAQTPTTITECSALSLASPMVEGAKLSGADTPMTEDKEDQEATAALLMLNTDRRWSGPSGVRGMSVRDLLSS